MADNVIIFGAGASVDAGIPVLGNFMQIMWEISKREAYNGKPLEHNQLQVLKRAVNVRDNFGNYHRNANFDDRNIEDILSLLSFNKLAGVENAESDYDVFVNAISIVIQITNNVNYVHNRAFDQIDSNSFYVSFWKGILNKFPNLDFPSIITFNYDLVLENSLLGTFFSTSFHNTNPPINGIRFKYGFDKFKTKIYNVNPNRDLGTNDTEIMSIEEASKLPGMVEINYFKLHGSLNFPTNFSETPFINAFEIQEKPLLLPPIFNKLNDKFPSMIWENAISELRSAKNIIIVGYSMPFTDIYMQYFLKAALGPNSDLNKIIVYNPTLFKNNTEAEEMKNRFRNCFSKQMFDKINFNPVVGLTPQNESGKFTHFINDIFNSESKIFF